MIWLTSDLHFCHDRYFIYEPRGFENIEDMNETIVNNIRSVVSWEDDLYILGDCFLRDDEKGMKLLRRLPGRLHIIRGNHDTDARVEAMLNEPRITFHGYADVLKYGKYYFYLCHYPTITSNHDTHKYLTRRLINLCGHSHTKDKFQDMDKGLCYHVELDAHNLYPVSIDQVITDIKEKINE